MQTSTLSSCLMMLASMQSGRDQDLRREELKAVYSLVLTSMHDRDAEAAVKWAMANENWRPSPARLLDIAAELASPIPDAEATYAEIMHRAITEGKNAVPHPERPSIKLPGPPRFSHPIVETVTRYCGGWVAICDGEANMSEGLRKQVRSAHESVARDWRQLVKAQLVNPPARRDPKLFPTWKPYALPSSWSPEAEPLAIEARPETPQLAAIPEAIREQINRLAASRSLPPAPAKQWIADPPKESVPDLTPEKRREVEADLQKVAERIKAAEPLEIINASQSEYKEEAAGQSGRTQAADPTDAAA